MASPTQPARNYYYKRCGIIRKCKRHSGEPLSSATSDEDGLSDYGIDVDDDETPEARLRSNKLTIPTPRMDTYRFSMANMEDSQDIELDAILGELCALETEFDNEMMALPKSQSANHPLNQSCSAWKSSSNNNNNNNNCRSSAGLNGRQSQPPLDHHKPVGHRRSNSGGGGGARPRFELGGLQIDVYDEDFLKSSKNSSDYSCPRTDSPDNDSAFSDSVSMMSSESSASSGGVPRGDASSRSISSQSSSMSLASSPTQAEQAARIKAEKIKIALEKMKEASIKKLFIKAFSADNSAKSLMIDETMTVGHVCRQLAEKNHVPMDTRWALVEHIPELYMERVYEDHEHVVENLLLWTSDSCNQLLFLSRQDKYDLFRNPQLYLLLRGTSSERDMSMDEEAKLSLVEEFFCSSSGTPIPEVEGPLYLKSDGKKAWKKHFFVLRASGLYYCPKGKSKLSKDLLCLSTFEMSSVYFGIGWKKKYKAPTDFCFAIKHPQIQTKSSKYIKYLCAEEESILHQWVMGIRTAKYGKKLKQNYDDLLRDIEEEDIDILEHARSFPVPREIKAQPDCFNSHRYSRGISARGNQDSSDPPTTIERLCKGKIIHRQDSIKSSKSNKSNASSLSGRSSTGTPTDQNAFETDFPMGTIKRKPSMTPKIPLTSTTRNLAMQSGDDAALETPTLGSSGSGGSLSGSLGRAAGSKFSLRRSKTDDRIIFSGSLSRKAALKLTTREHKDILREDLPLPPPPLLLPAESRESFNFDTLPPPPPEAFRSSNISLNNLPPPPPVPAPSKPLVPMSGDTDDSYSSAGSLSPDRHPDCRKYSPAVPPKPRKGVQRRQSEADAFIRYVPSERHNESVIVKPKPSKHNLNLDLCPKPDKVEGSKHCRNASPSKMNRSRRISAPCVPAQLQVFSPSSPSPTSDRQSRLHEKPSPPKRSENTKLSSAFTAPQRRSASASAVPYEQDPPESFLRDLQKVMVKNWKVAQQLMEESVVPTSPQPILGFRDPTQLPKPAHKHRHHRANSSPPPVPNHGKEKASRLHHYHNHHRRSHSKGSNADAKLPPPPPPKRSHNSVEANA